MFLEPSLLVRTESATFNAAAESSMMLQCKDIDHCRTLQSIIYSCFSTVFLCTWTALHLNIPYPPLLRRVGWMLGALIAPEVVFVEAFNDWTNSSDLLGKILKNYPGCGWTETHAQFVRMGGFHLVDANGKTFRRCVKDGTIDLPKVSKDEILGRCKGDLVAKIFTVIQTAWFVFQCIHRRSQNLLLTELEITTLGHTLINFCIYFFWWHKPLGVTIPIEVPFKERRPETIGGRDDKVESKGGSLDGDDNVQVPRSTEIGPTQPPPISDVEASNDIPMPRHSWYTRLGIKTFSVNDPEPLSMPARLLNTILNTIFVIVGGAFGAMHCLAWNFESAFLTRVEQYIWQVSSLIVTVIGSTTLVYLINRRKVDYFLDKKGGAGALVGIILIFIPLLVYCFARISLLVLALLQLRALPYVGYETPSWSIFYPHIG